ncbi:MAG: RHS repeat-associated core domain-containing protein [Xanthomonadaceae bacterium]|nr:RHS repeat-associated core domain-containing protein [Xanthomonadaceae bacterium]
MSTPMPCAAPAAGAFQPCRHERARRTRTPRIVGALLALLLWGTAHAGTVTYVYTDPQGTPLAEADASGTITATFDYAPYGKQALGTAPNGPGYTGHVNDPDTGLVYMQARYYDPVVGRFLSVDPIGPTAGNAFNFNRFVYANDNPYRYTDPFGMCADHYKNGSCMVHVDSATGKAGIAAGKQLEGVLNKYDKAINALSDKAKFNIKDTKGKVIGSMTGKEIKAVWNGTHFTITNKAFNNGGAGGGTGGTWHGDSFSGQSELNPRAVSGYANAASARNENANVGVSTLTFHELGHETHFGEGLTNKYPVTPTLSIPREQGASSAGDRMSQTAGAPFDCSIPMGGCQ